MRSARTAVVIAVVLSLHGRAVAAPVPLDSARIDPWRLGAVCGASTVGFVYGHILQNHLWWKGDYAPFHFTWTADWRYALGADKFGHGYFPYLASNVYQQLLQWCGVDSMQAQWDGSAIALGYETYVELRDGFSAAWGFSWGDFGADVLGAAFPIAQHYVPPLRAVRWKISYDPSGRFKAGSNRVIIDDYESTYGWMSVDVHALAGWTWWPRWANLALGHSVKELDGFGGGYHELYLAIDWNLEGLPGEGWFWKLVKKNLNFYHFPSPAVRLAPTWWAGIKL